MVDKLGIGINAQNDLNSSMKKEEPAIDQYRISGNLDKKFTVQSICS
jgi:hypothetical protein